VRCVPSSVEGGRRPVSCSGMPGLPGLLDRDLDRRDGVPRAAVVRMRWPHASRTLPRPRCTKEGPVSRPVSSSDQRSRCRGSRVGAASRTGARSCLRAHRLSYATGTVIRVTWCCRAKKKERRTGIRSQSHGYGAQSNEVRSPPNVAGEVGGRARMLKAAPPVSWF